MQGEVMLGIKATLEVFCVPLFLEEFHEALIASSPVKLLLHTYRPGMAYILLSIGLLSSEEVSCANFDCAEHKKKCSFCQTLVMAIMVVALNCHSFKCSWCNLHMKVLSALV